MPKIITTTVYTYDELTDERAKERARNWLRDVNAGDNFFAEPVTGDFKETLSALGFDITDRRGDTLEWSLGYSQGDGAAFSGTWYASECAPGKLLADRPTQYIPAGTEGPAVECKSNAELHRIAAEILACKKAGLSSATITKSHSGFFMSLDDARTDLDDDADLGPGKAVSDRFIEAVRDLARMFYNALRDEHMYQNSDEVIAESLVANWYTFTADGKREG
jgi:hypothetical protein